MVDELAPAEGGPVAYAPERARADCMSIPAAVDRWPLVGRWDGLDAVERAITDTVAADGIVLFGPPGVGKTRLADEMRRQLERAGRVTRRAVASRTAATAPFGAVAHLLPSDIVSRAAVDDPAATFQRAAEVFAALGSSPVLVVDDVHLLDATS